MADHTMRRGDKRIIRLTFRDGNDDLQSLTGLSLKFTAKHHWADDQADAPIRKTSDVAGEIDILTQSGATLGQADVTIEAADTIDFPPYAVKLVYDAEAEGEITTETGTLTVAPDVTTPPS